MKPVPARTFSHPLALERLADALRNDDVWAAAIAIATQHDPQIRPAALNEFLDRMAADARRMISMDSDPMGVLKHVMFDRFGFMGNIRNYQDPLNSCIDGVLVRRTGLPILLSLVYVEMARRAEITAYGIGLPGHFVAAADVDGVRHYVDAFNQGKEISPQDCKEIALAQSQFWAELFLVPVRPAAWVERILSNLRNVYVQRNDLPNSAAILEQLLLVDADNEKVRQDLGQLHEELERRRVRDN